MAFWDSQETKEKKSHFKNLIMLACVDGDFDDNEKKFLIQRGIDWGLSEKQAISVIQNPQSVKLVIPKDPNKRLAQLEDLVVMTLADGVIEQIEVDFVQTLAVQMGFRPSDVERMIVAIIEAVKANSKPDVDAGEFLAEG